MLPTQTPCPPNDKLALCENPIIDVSDADWCDIVFYCLYSAWNKWVATGQQSPGLQRVAFFFLTSTHNNYSLFCVGVFK